jgi:hypothetical protein
MSLKTEGWKYRLPITINNTEVSSDEVNWTFVLDQDFAPVLKSENGPLDLDGTRPFLSGGGDIRLALDETGSTLIPCHVLECIPDNNPAAGSLYIQTRIPLVTAFLNTTIWLFWGKDGATQPPAADLLGRHYSVDDYTTANVPFADTRDFSSFDSVGSVVGSVIEAGEDAPVGRGTYFPGPPNNCIVFDRAFTGAGLNFTIEMLQKHEDNMDIYSEHKLNHFNDSLRFRHISGNFQFMVSINGIYSSTEVRAGGARTNTWQHSALRRNGTYYDLIQNGAIADFEDDPAFNTPIPNQVETNFAAVWYNGGYNLGAQVTLAQIRVSNVTRSENWVQMNHKNQMNETGFLTWGEIEAVQGGVIIEPGSVSHDWIYDVEIRENGWVSHDWVYDVEIRENGSVSHDWIYDVEIRENGSVSHDWVYDVEIRENGSVSHDWIYEIIIVDPPIKTTPPTGFLLRANRFDSVDLTYSKKEVELIKKTIT